MFIAMFVALLLVSPLAAQQANIASPTPGPTITKILIARFEVSRNPASAIVEFSYQDSSSSEIQRLVFRVPQDQGNPGTEMADFLAAMITPRASETGGSARRLNYRILGYFLDAGRMSGVTLVP